MDANRVLYRGRYLRMAAKGSWEYVERTNPQGAVIVVAVTPEDRVLLVEQHRVPIDRRTIEFPAGLIGDDPGEQDEAITLAARRELLEETGWAAGRVDYLMGGPSSAGMSTEIMHFVRAFDLRREHAGGGIDGEDITVHEVPRSEVADFVHRHLLQGFGIDPKVYAGLYFLERDAAGRPWSEHSA